MLLRVIGLRLGEIARRVLHELGHGLLAAEAIGLALEPRINLRRAKLFQRVTRISTRRGAESEPWEKLLTLGALKSQIIGVRARLGLLLPNANGPGL
jgi:hypothetical protein